LQTAASLLLSGVAVGAIAANAPSVAYMTAGITELESISPSVLFAVFLPALITPSGINLRWHLVRLTIDKSLALAIIGTMFNAALIALVARYVFPYNWSWAGCWLFASILAATDPVAVSALI
jgi:NhaP-type Na+/H+ or K+/H+ antiporter